MTKDSGIFVNFICKIKNLFAFNQILTYNNKDFDSQIIKAIRCLNGRATALQISVYLDNGNGNGESPFVEIRSRLDAMIAEGVIAREWKIASPWDSSHRQYYIIKNNVVDFL